MDYQQQQLKILMDYQFILNKHHYLIIYQHFLNHLNK